MAKGLEPGLGIHCNPGAPYSILALTTSWICFWSSKVQILDHACKIANWFSSGQLGFLTLWTTMKISSLCTSHLEPLVSTPSPPLGMTRAFTFYTSEGK